MTPVFVVARYTVLEALRNRLLGLALVLLVAGFGLAEFIGALAITETVQFQSSFLGALLRIAAVLVTSLFVITSMVREFNDKGLELVLSLPIPRASYFLGKLAGFSFLAIIAALLCSVLLLIYAPPAQVALWGVSLTCELILIIALSILCLFTLSQVTIALTAVLAFYMLSRVISTIQLIARGPLTETDSVSQQVLRTLVDALAFLLPELHRFTASEWLAYHNGDWKALALVLGQTLIYLVFLAGAGLFDLYRKNL